MLLFSQRAQERANLIESQQRQQQRQFDEQIDFSSIIIAEREIAIRDIERTMSVDLGVVFAAHSDDSIVVK